MMIMPYIVALHETVCTCINVEMWIHKGQKLNASVLCIL